MVEARYQTLIQWETVSFSDSMFIAWPASQCSTAAINLNVGLVAGWNTSEMNVVYNLTQDKTISRLDNHHVKVDIVILYEDSCVIWSCTVAHSTWKIPVDENVWSSYDL